LPSSDPAEDLGLLAPGRAGSAAQAATGDAAYVRAMLDAQAALGLAHATAAQAVTAAAADSRRYEETA
jgi:3-carboxy-cis,cis-muconate cycloisomerase